MFWSQPNKLIEEEEVNSTPPSSKFFVVFYYLITIGNDVLVVRVSWSQRNQVPIHLLVLFSPSPFSHPMVSGQDGPHSSLHAGSSLPPFADATPAPFTSLSLQHEISLNLSLLWQLLLTHIIWTDSILSQFVLHDLMKEEGGVLSPSISNFSVAQNSCHWQPSSMSRFLGATNFSSRYPAFEAAARQAEIEQLAHKDPRLSLFSDGYKNPGDFTCG